MFSRKIIYEIALPFWLQNGCSFTRNSRRDVCKKLRVKQHTSGILRLGEVALHRQKSRCIPKLQVFSNTSMAGLVCWDLIVMQCLALVLEKI